MDSDAITELHTPQLRLTDSVNKLFQRPEVPGPTSYTNYAMGFRNGYYRGICTESNLIVKVTKCVCKTVGFDPDKNPYTGSSCPGPKAVSRQ